MAKRIIQLIGLAILIAVGVYLYTNYKTWDETGQLAAQVGIFAIGGILLAYFAVTVVLPMFGEAAAGSLLGSNNEKLEPEKTAAATSKLAQGDYEGAVAEFQKLREDDPEDTFPVWEIAKIYAERSWMQHLRRVNIS